MTHYPPMPPVPYGPPPHKAIPAGLAAMPAYTLGFLSPVPFFYAAVKLRLRYLWALAALYTAVWITMWVLVTGVPDNTPASTVGGALMFGLAAGGTVHAFALRERLPHQQRLPYGMVAPAQPEPPVALPPSDPDAISVVQLRASLVSLKSYIESYAQSFPPACRELLDEITGQLTQVVNFAANDGHADAELRSVHAMLTDYLPTSINTYVRLPRQYALTQANPDGKTAAEEFEEQLRLLRDSAKDAAGSLYRGDALRLQEQSAFLRSKFGTSELDLP